MKLTSLCLKAVMFLSISFINLSAEDKLITVISPLDNRLQTELTMNVVLKIKKQSSDTLKIDTSVKQLVIDLNSSQEMKCKNISLKLGENTISIRTYKNNIMVDEITRHIYVLSQLHHQYKYPPEVYKQSYFHNDSNEALCSKCHNMSVNEQEGIAFIDVTKSNCYMCHKNLTKEKYAHAPAVNWLCTSCHNENKKNQSKYIAPEPVNHSCFKCHKENQKLWNSSKYHHEPLDSGHCTKCHNPHSSPYNMFVRKAVNEICLGCHKDKQVQAINTENSQCPGTSDGSLCVKCHTPHASNQPFFVKKILNEVMK